MSKTKISLIIILFSLSLFINKTAEAVTFKSTVYVTAKDANYQTLKNVNFNIYQQKSNADGTRYAGSSVASGSTKDIGIAELTLNVDNAKPMYMAKFYTKNSTVGPIFFYDLDLSNAYTYNLIVKLSSLRIVLRDAEGNILPAQKFSLYAQKGKSGNTYIKGEAYSTGLATDSFGLYETFLGAGTYLIEIPVANNLILQKGDLKITKEQRTSLEYNIGQMVIRVKDENGLTVPKQKFEIYQQVTNNQGQPALGKLTLSSDTGTDGVKKLLLPPATYALKFYLLNKQTATVFDKVLADSSLLDINYENSGLKLILKDADGLCIKNKAVEAYIQKCATCGTFLGNKVASGKTNESGEIGFQLLPETYIVKIAGNKGFDYYLFDQKINAGEAKVITEHLSLIRVTSKKTSGEVLKNTKVTISSQKLDINKKPIADKAIITLDTKDTGQADYYLPAGKYIATYNKNQVAVLEVKRGHMTKLYIIDEGKKFSYPIEMISLGPIDEGTIKPKIIISFYGKARLGSLAQEQELARQLKEELEKITGAGRIGLARAYWPVFVNAYIYGEYTPAEIADTIKNGPLAVHPNIPANAWRGSANYQKYLQRMR